MIEIIKRGTKKTHTCNKCGCYFSYEEEDVETEVWHSFDLFQMGSDTREDFVQCPQCDEKVILKQTK